MNAKSTHSDKPKKPKLVRDSFCMPKGEYAAIDALKARALGMSINVKKSELLRAGLIALQALGDPALKRVLSSVPTLKTGRPPAQSADEVVPVSTLSPAAPEAKVSPAAAAAAPRKRRTTKTAA